MPEHALAARRITHELLSSVPGTHHARVVPTTPGTVAATAYVVPPPGLLVGDWKVLRRDGERVRPGTPLVSVRGTAVELMAASDHVLGVLGVAGGFADRARSFVDAAPPGLRIVCGGWKKLPSALKPVLRHALDAVGVGHRLVDGPFVYIDKNAVRLAGGISRAVHAGLELRHGPVSVQVTTAEGAVRAADAGAAIVMVDTGNLKDLREVRRALDLRFGARVPRLAFGGGVELARLEDAAHFGASIVDIGRAILDAPLWDLRFELRGHAAGCGSEEQA